MSKNPSTQEIVKDLLDDLFGTDKAHAEIAYELVVSYNDAQGSLKSVLRYLKYYQEQGLL